MKTKKIILKMLVYLLLFFCLTGCGRHEAAGEENIGLIDEVSEDGDIRKEPEKSDEEDTAKELDPQLADKIAAEMEKEEETIKKGLTEERISPAVKEMPVDFPFWSSAHMEEVDYFSLTLAELKEPAGEYELRLYNKEGDVLQQVSCGKLTEPIEISFGDFNDYPDRNINDMEIFSAGSSRGLYIRWDDLGLRFGKDAVEIPRYDEVRNGKMLVLEDGDTYQIKKILELDQAYGQGNLEVRRWLLNRKTGELEIWDCLDGVSLFKGTVKLDNEGNPVNKEYYDMLLREDTYRIYDDKTSLYSWTMIRGEWTDDGEWIIKYKSREEMLDSLGFADSEPVFQYYDWHHNLRLELYMDETMRKGCGIDYEYFYNSKLEKITEACGFVIEDLEQAEVWTDRDIYEEMSVLGPEHAENFEEITEYTSDGKPDYYRAQGLVAFNSLEGPIPTVLLELEYIYRDDGSLFYRYFLPYQRLWGSVGSTYSFFDEKERPVYEEESISYKPVRHYYFYQDGKDKPAFHLEVGYHLDKARLFPIK